MANRTTRDKLKRALSENCVRNLEANQEKLVEFLAIYSESDENAMEVAHNLDALIEAHEELKNAIIIYEASI